MDAPRIFAHTDQAVGGGFCRGQMNVCELADRMTKPVIKVSGRYVTVRERASWTSKSGEKRSQASLAVYEIRDGLVARVWYYPAE